MAEGFDEWYRFRAASTGVLIGCLTVNFNKPQKDLTIPISTAGACADK
jgi:hypothetical protein